VKFEKLDPKEAPKVIILGVLAVGAVGYGAMQLMPASKPAAVPAAAAAPTAVQTASASTGQPGVDGEAPVPDRTLQLPELYNPDPFKPAKVPPAERSSGVVVVPKPSKPHYDGPKLPPAGIADLGNPGNRSPGSGSGSTKPAPAGPPPRPTLVVTGIIDSRDGSDMAIMDVGPDHRLAQVGDEIANRYRVARIVLDGVWLSNGKDRYFVALGPQNPSQTGKTNSGT
jgi:hypothetical protein